MGSSSDPYRCSEVHPCSHETDVSIGITHETDADIKERSVPYMGHMISIPQQLYDDVIEYLNFQHTINFNKRSGELLARFKELR